MITQQKYTLKSYILIFFIFSFIGWCYELLLHLIIKGGFINPGFFSGPYLPIYGSGGLCVIVFLRKLYNRPVVTFFISMGICATIEYLTSYVLQLIYHKLWWDYSDMYLNLNGRIFVGGIIIFGIFCIIINYFGFVLK